MHGSITGEAIKGHAMIVMSTALCAGVFYWLGVYKLAFWILTYATVYGGLGVLRGGQSGALGLSRRFRPDHGGADPGHLAYRHIGVLAGYL